MKIDLAESILVDGEAVYSLDIKKPNFGHIIDMSAKIAYRDPNDIRITLYRDPSEAEQSLALIASVAGITQQEARRLTMADAQKIIDELTPFLAGRATASIAV